jgi:hypothetical protein
VSLGSKIVSSEKIGNEYKFLEFILVSLNIFFDKKPVLILLSLTDLKLVLYSTSCFLKKSDEEAFCFILKYSSWNDEL